MGSNAFSAFTLVARVERHTVEMCLLTYAPDNCVRTEFQVRELPVVPRPKITGKGLVDVETQQLVSLFLN